MDVTTGSYRVLYEAAYADIENIINSNTDVKNWNFDVLQSPRSTFYIQVGGDITGDNGNGNEVDNEYTNVKVERVSAGIVDGKETFKWEVDPEAEILVNMDEKIGTPENDVLISGNTAETIIAGKGSDIMMGRGGSDNYKILQGDTIEYEMVDGFSEMKKGDYGVAGDVINEIGGSSDDKSDSITLSSVTNINQLSFSRTEIKHEDYSNTLKIDVDYNDDDDADTKSIDDTIYVFDHYNENLGFRSVEKLYLDDGWDAHEIWNFVTGETTSSDNKTIDNYTGSDAQDILMAGIYESVLTGGAGKDILIGENFTKFPDVSIDTKFVIGSDSTTKNIADSAWEGIADMIQNFGDGDQLDLTKIGITADAVFAKDENKLLIDGVVVAEFSNFLNEITIDEFIVANSDHIIYS